MGECLPLRDPCKMDGSLGWCCSTFCFVGPGQEIGFCANLSCLEEGDQCQGSGAIGFCCSGVCKQDIGNQFGICGNKTVSETPGDGQQLLLDTNQIFGIVFGCVTVVLLLVLISVALWVRRYKRAALLTESEIRVFLDGTSASGTTDDEESGEGLTRTIRAAPYDKNYEICESDFTIDHSTVLGNGEFSIVMKAFVRGLPAAAKTVRLGTRDANYLKALLTELKILIHVGKHPNVVSLLGANTVRLSQGSCYVFLEFCEHGSLESYLRAHRGDIDDRKGSVSTIGSDGGGSSASFTMVKNYVQCEFNPAAAAPSSALSLDCLLRWCREIAAGMAYLSDLQVVHGDLAARNVLLGPGLIAKISDFGLSKRLYTYSNYVGSKDIPLPWRHLAPESLTQLVFSTESDAWSFGITMWEIYSLGDVPYPGLEWTAQFVECLTHNMRPRKPQHASDALYEIMMKCWALAGGQRPSFHWLHSMLLRNSS